MTKTMQRVVGIAAAMYVILSVIGNEVFGKAGEAPMWDDGAEAAATFAQSQLEGGLFPLAAMLEMLALTALLVFAVGLGTLLRDAPRGGPVPAGLAVAAGGVAAAVKAASGAPMLVAVLRAGETSPEMTRLLYDINAASFALTAPFLGALLAATAVAGRHSQVVARPLAYAAAPLAVGGMVVPLLVAGDAAFVPVLLMLLWILITGVSLVVRRQESRVPQPVLT